MVGRFISFWDSADFQGLNCCYVFGVYVAFVGECHVFFLGGGGRKGGKQNKGPKIKTSCFSGCSNVKKGSLHMNLYNRKYNLQGEFSGV